MLSRFITNFTGFCSSYVKVNFFTNNFGEGFEFDHKLVISLIWRHTGKDLIAESRPTNVVLTADGSKLTNNINVVLMGLKETEAYESMSLIGSHLLKFSNKFDTEADGSLSVQSAFLSFRIMAQLGPESSDVIDTVFKRKYQSIVKATYFDTLRMAGKATIDPKNAVLKRKCDPEMMTDASKDKFKQIPGKIMFGNGVSWTCLISLDLKRKFHQMHPSPEVRKYICIASVMQTMQGTGLRVARRQGLSYS